MLPFVADLPSLILLYNLLSINATPRGTLWCSFQPGEGVRSLLSGADFLLRMNYAQKPGFLGMSVARSPEDEQKQVWSKLQALSVAYLEDMIELYGMLTARSNQPMPAEQLQKLKHYKDVLHRMIPYLRVPENRVPKEFNVEKVDAFEKQIVNIMETFKRRRQGAA